MSEVVIKVEQLSKKYEIGRQKKGNLRETLTEGWKKLWHFSDSSPDENNDFWALKDVSFSIKKGEIVGIIGRNGAGKSTLLKILSRITEPTAGRIELTGRVASLLEVGTGFHPELTGRENIFLNGSLLGMKRKEIKQKFDEIIDFSGVEAFIDTPVKRYSSGMYVRLAFAVAAHLEPEILLVDEVLAVGDAEFQKKCLGKIDDVAKGGRTVLLVSHNMGVISGLCSKGILLSNGQLTSFDSIENTIMAYSQSYSLNSKSIIDNISKTHKNLDVLDIKVNDETNTNIELALGENRINIHITFKAKTRLQLSLAAILFDQNGTQIGFYSPGHVYPEKNIFSFTKGIHQIEGQILLPNLHKGNYFMSISLHFPGIVSYFNINEAFWFHHPGIATKIGVRFKSIKNGYFLLDGNIKKP